MSLPPYSQIIAKYPKERASVESLEDFIRTRSAKGTAIYTLERLSEIAKPSSYEALALVLGELVQRRILDLVIRVESPGSRGGIGDYHTLLEVPSQIQDWRSDTMIKVTPENLRVLYRIPSGI
jgi:hypothetical protein